VNEIIGLLPYAENAWLAFLTLWAALILFHVSVHFVTAAILIALARSQKWRKIQARETRVPASSEIRESFSGFLGTPFCLSLGLWAQYQDWALPPMETSVWTVLVFFLIATLIHDLWFYSIHRLLHTKWLFKWHIPHHKSPVPTVWTNDRFTLLDVLMTQCFLIWVVFVLPIPPLALLLYRLSDHIKGLIGHSGFEFAASRLAIWPMPFVCVTHHDGHHELFHYNFGNTLSIWDRLFGTLDPEYDAKVLAVRERLAEKQPPQK